MHTPHMPLYSRHRFTSNPSAFLNARCKSIVFSHMHHSITLTSQFIAAWWRTKTLPGRLELPTLRLTASRSNQLSYGSNWRHINMYAWWLACWHVTRTRTRNWGSWSYTGNGDETRLLKLKYNYTTHCTYTVLLQEPRDTKGTGGHAGE